MEIICQLICQILVHSFIADAKYMPIHATVSLHIKQSSEILLDVYIHWEYQQHIDNNKILHVLY